MKFLLKKNQVLKPFQDLVSDSNDKKVLSNPIVLFFGVLWALVILGDIFFKYSGYQTVRFPLFWLLETFIYIAAGTFVLAAFIFVPPPISIWGDMHPKREKIEEKWQNFLRRYDNDNPSLQNTWIVSRFAQKGWWSGRVQEASFSHACVTRAHSLQTCTFCFHNLHHRRHYSSLSFLTPRYFSVFSARLPWSVFRAVFSIVGRKTTRNVKFCPK